MLSLILIIIAGVCDAVMDKLKSHFSKSIFKNLNGLFWNPSISWPNKWEVGSTTKEKFFGSSTFLVWTTDAWHLFKSIKLMCIMAAIVFYAPMINWWADFLILRLSYAIVFEGLFTYIFSKKD